MLVQELTLKAAELFHIDTEISVILLRHRNRSLNAAEVVFHIGLPNNAVVDVEVSTRKGGAGSGIVKLIIVGRDKASVSLAVSADFLLRDIIEHESVCSLKLPEESINGLTYMRRPYAGDELGTVSLRSLGLTGQSAKLQLTFVQGTDITISQDISNATSNTTIPNTGGVREQGGVDATTPVPSAPTTPPLSVLPPAIPVAAPASGLVDSSSTEDKHPSAHVYDMSPALVEAKLEEAIKFLLTNNFDIASKAGVILLLKYVDNILLNLGNPKFYRFPVSNKAYSSKLATLSGSEKVLQGAGFYLNDNTWMACAEAEAAGEGHWKLIRRKLVGAAEELQIPEDSYSKHPPRALEAVKPTVQFDPFRAMVTKTAGSTENGGNTKVLDRSDGQAVSPQYRTATDKQLAAAERRRNDLEGRPEDVERNTEVANSLPLYLISKLDNIPWCLSGFSTFKPGR